MRTNRKYCRQSLSDADKAFQPQCCSLTGLSAAKRRRIVAHGWSEAEPWVRTPAAPTPQGAQENNLSIPTVDRSVLCPKKYTDLASIGTNRPAMHHAPALGASSQLGASPLLPAPSLSSSPKTSARQASSPASLSTKGSAPAKKHPQPPRNCKVSGTFQPENSRKKGNTYYKQNHQTTHSYTTYGNTRGTEKEKIAKTLSYPDIFCQNTT